MKFIKLLSIVMVASVSMTMAQDPDPSCACPCPMMGRGKNVMEWHQKALEKFKAQNAELDKLIQTMNSAKGEKKVEAMAAIINKAMEQRKAWQTDMEARQKKMMEWMKNRPMMRKGGAMKPAEPSASPTVTP